MEQARRMLFEVAAFVLFVLFVSTISVPAFAEELSFLNKNCSEYSSGRAFVKKAVMSCLRLSNSRRCERQAESYFEQCGFEGDYVELSDKIRSDLLMLIVLQGTPSLKSSAEKKKL